MKNVTNMEKFFDKCSKMVVVYITYGELEYKTLRSSRKNCVILLKNWVTQIILSRRFR